MHQWSKHKSVSLETRRRDGSWVPTVVSLVVDSDGRAYFRTYDASGKAKRMRNFPQVRVAPCGALRGKPTGEAVPATARLLVGGEAEHARALLKRQHPVLHGLVVPRMHRRKGWTTQHYELAWADQPARDT